MALTEDQVTIIKLERKWPAFMVWISPRHGWCALNRKADSKDTISAESATELDDKLKHEAGKDDE